MGTSNFHSVNAGNTYAVLMNYEQPMYTDTGEETDKTETVVCDEHDVNDLISNLRSEAERIAKENNFKYHLHLELSDPHELHSFCSSPLFQIYSDRWFGDVHVEVNINCVMRSGYYEGACLDWFDSCVYHDDTIEFNEIDYEITDYMSQMNAGLRKIQEKNAKKWLWEQRNQIIELVEKIFTENSTPLSVTARFSNGETIYSKVS